MLQLTSSGTQQWIPPQAVKSVTEDHGGSRLWLGGSDSVWVQEPVAEVIRQWRDMMFCLDTAQSAVAKLNEMASRKKELVGS